MGFSIIGGASGILQEVEAATLAARVTSRYTDPGGQGHYLQSFDNGTTGMTAGWPRTRRSSRSAGATRRTWRSSTAIRMSAACTTAFAAGRFAFDAFFARSFTASDTGGTAPTITGANGKKRTSYATTLVTDLRLSATATLSAGTRTLDANPFGKLHGVVGTGANTQFVNPNTQLFVGRDNSDQIPLVFAQNEGFVIQATVPATGVWFFSVTLDWLEILTSTGY
jgi:hypothetical protein